jgi:hypothetical protein
LLYDKIEEYQTKFNDAAPSSAVKVPTLISPKAQTAYNFVEGINQPAASTPAVISGKAVSLAAARQLPTMKGLSDDQIRAAIQAQGHQVIQ